MYSTTSSGPLCCSTSCSTRSNSGRGRMEKVRGVTETLVAIQWHISLHSGLLRDGASGSVRVITYVGWVSVVLPELVSSCKVMDGSFWRCLGLIVLPSEASSFFQDTDRVRLGRKSSITVGLSETGASLPLHGLITCGYDLGLSESALGQHRNVNATLTTHAACTACTSGEPFARRGFCSVGKA